MASISAAVLACRSFILSTLARTFATYSTIRRCSGSDGTRHRDLSHVGDVEFCQPEANFFPLPVALLPAAQLNLALSAAQVGIQVLGTDDVGTGAGDCDMAVRRRSSSSIGIECHAAQAASGGTGYQNIAAAAMASSSTFAADSREGDRRFHVSSHLYVLGLDEMVARRPLFGLPSPCEKDGHLIQC